MTQLLPAGQGLQGVTIRPYRPSDHLAGRGLWRELARYQADLYRDPNDQSNAVSHGESHGGSDGGSDGGSHKRSYDGSPRGSRGASAGARGRSRVDVGDRAPDLTRPTGADEGAGFEEYLTRLDLAGVWVAESDRQGVVGLVGLTLNGRAGAIDPLFVTDTMRRQGIGRALAERASTDARRRGLSRLSVSPLGRDRSALLSLHRAGFDCLASVTLTLDLTGGRPKGGPDVSLYGARFAV